MTLPIIRTRATKEQIEEMLKTLKTYVKVAVDIRRGILAGGGEFHADAEALLLEDGSRQEDIWGADWFPRTREVRCSALINIRPKQKNRSMAIQDSKIRRAVEQITKSLLER